MCVAGSGKGSLHGQASHQDSPRAQWSTADLLCQGSAFQLQAIDLRLRSPDPRGLTLDHWHHVNSLHLLEPGCLGGGAGLRITGTIQPPDSHLPIPVLVAPAAVLLFETPVSSGDSQL